MNSFSKQNDYSDIAWTCIKVGFIFFWISNMLIMLSDLSPLCFLSVGVCKLFCISFLFSPIGKLFLSSAVVVLSIFYWLEKKMFLVTLFQFVISTIIISHHESNGMFHHATIFSPIFAVQSLAYWQYQRNRNFDIAHFRVQYSVQMVVANYMLAGISKVSASGLEWINSGGGFALQVIKNYSFVYFATGSKEAMTNGYQIASFLHHYPYLINLFLAISLFLELCCFLALVSKKTRITFGISLILMHLGIWVVMGIPFGVIAPVMIVFFLNPLFALYQLHDKVISFLKTSK